MQRGPPGTVARLEAFAGGGHHLPTSGSESLHDSEADFAARVRRHGGRGRRGRHVRHPGLGRGRAAGPRPARPDRRRQPRQPVARRLPAEGRGRSSSPSPTSTTTTPTRRPTGSPRRRAATGPRRCATTARCSTATTSTPSSSPRPTTGTRTRRSTPARPARTSTARSRWRTTSSKGRAMVNAARKYDRVVAVGTQQRSSENFQKAVEAVRDGRDRPGPLGPDLELREHQPLRHGHRPRHRGPELRRLRRAGSARRRMRPFNINRFHLLFRWFFDYAGGMMSDWGVHLNDIVLWALDQQGPETVNTTGGIWCVKDDRDTPDTMQVVYEFPGDCVLTYSMRKGNGHPLDGHGYGIMFCGTDGTLFIDRSGHQIIPDKLAEPYGIKSIKGEMPTRPINTQPVAVQGRGRRPARPRRQLPLLPEDPRAADLRRRGHPQVDQHDAPRQHLLPARPQADLGRRDRDLPRRRRGQPAPEPPLPDRLRAARHLNTGTAVP